MAYDVVWRVIDVIEGDMKSNDELRDELDPKIGDELESTKKLLKLLTIRSSHAVTHNMVPNDYEVCISMSSSSSSDCIVSPIAVCRKNLDSVSNFVMLVRITNINSMIRRCRFRFFRRCSRM